MKVVVNRCFGGFGLSYEGVKRYFELQGWNMVFVKYDYDTKTHTVLDELSEADKNSIMRCSIYKNAYVEGDDANYFYEGDLVRNDPVLVQVVEELGKSANGWAADLEVVEIPDDVKWVIKEYDGREWVAEVHRTW